jgi:hypothetical protein
MNLNVRCYSGYTCAEEPRSVTINGIEHQVTEIERAWREPGKRCFLVITGDSKIFKLCYNEPEGTWSASEVVRR